jgi:hypothetical protein
MIEGGAGRKRRKAGAADVANARQERDSTMTKIDCLIEVAKKLREARTFGEGASDFALLYFIDMTLAHVCDSLDVSSETKAGEDKPANLIKAAA